MPRWSKLRKLSWSERGFLCVAPAGLATVGLLLPLLGFERTLSWLRRSSDSRGPAPAQDLRSRDWARRRAYLIAVAARFGPYRATCLRRSLFLWWLTRRHGLETKLRIGVRRPHSEAPSAGGLHAHSWIELDGEVLGDRADRVAAYAAFDAKSLPRRVSWS